MRRLIRSFGITWKDCLLVGTQRERQCQHEVRRYGRGNATSAPAGDPRPNSFIPPGILPTSLITFQGIEEPRSGRRILRRSAPPDRVSLHVLLPPADTRPGPATQGRKRPQRLPIRRVPDELCVAELAVGRVVVQLVGHERVSSGHLGPPVTTVSRRSLRRRAGADWQGRRILTLMTRVRFPVARSITKAPVRGCIR
jgi:hypothetical protein